MLKILGMLDIRVCKRVHVCIKNFEYLALNGADHIYFTRAKSSFQLGN